MGVALSHSSGVSSQVPGPDLSPHLHIETALTPDPCKEATFSPYSDQTSMRSSPTWTPAEPAWVPLRLISVLSYSIVCMRVSECVCVCELE